MQVFYSTSTPRLQSTIDFQVEDLPLIKHSLQTEPRYLYITGRRLSVLEKAAASVTGVRGSRR